jgi:rod shape-determining protein MreB
MKGDHGLGLSLDLGTTNVLVHCKRRGLVVDDSTALAMRDAGRLGPATVVAAGWAAEKTEGRTTHNVHIIRPLARGMVADAHAASTLLSTLTALAAKSPAQQISAEAESFLQRWNPFQWSDGIVVSVPFGASSLEAHAFVEAARGLNKNAMGLFGPRTVRLVSEPMAAALGEGLDVHQPEGVLVVDAGSGITEAVLLSLGAVVAGASLRLGGRDFDAAIVRYLRARHGLVVANDVAERLKKTVCRARRGADAKSGTLAQVEVCGLSVRDRRPVRIFVPQEELSACLDDLVDAISLLAVQVLSRASPDLVSDVGKNGLLVTGGLSLLPGFVEALGMRAGVTARRAQAPLRSVIQGHARILESSDLQTLCTFSPTEWTRERPRENHARDTGRS